MTMNFFGARYLRQSLESQFLSAAVAVRIRKVRFTTGLGMIVAGRRQLAAQEVASREAVSQRRWRSLSEEAQDLRG